MSINFTKSINQYMAARLCGGEHRLHLYGLVLSWYSGFLPPPKNMHG